jgi:hypothetical protein
MERKVSLRLKVACSVAILDECQLNRPSFLRPSGSACCLLHWLISTRPAFIQLIFDTPG